MLSVARTLLKDYPGRTTFGLVLMSAQAFIYNAIFFTYALVLTRFYGIAADKVGLYILPFAVGNFLGPLLLGRLFDTRGRRPMIAFTYVVSGILLALTGWLFLRNLVDETTQTVCWMVIFFFASAAASSAYLTVSETFPLEIRALAIAFFYAVGTGAFGTLSSPGVTGDIVFSACLDDVADTYLATYRGGAWTYVSRSELGIPRGYIAPRDRPNRDAETASAGLKASAARR